MKKQTYKRPEIWVDKLSTECPLLGLSRTVTNIEGKSGETNIFGYGGGGSGPARAGENGLWDDEDGGSEWDQL